MHLSICHSGFSVFCIPHFSSLQAVGTRNSTNLGIVLKHTHRVHHVLAFLFFFLGLLLRRHRRWWLGRRCLWLGHGEHGSSGNGPAPGRDKPKVQTVGTDGKVRGGEEGVTFPVFALTFHLTCSVSYLSWVYVRR